MKIIVTILKVIGRTIRVGIILWVCGSLVYIGYKGNRPMQVAEAPTGMTYFEFMADRLDAARTVKPARCGWGMISTLAVLGPIYSIVYTEAAIHPEGFIGRVTAKDPNIAADVANVNWYEVPGIWWGTVERLSWSMLGLAKPNGCQFRPVAGY